MSEEENVKQHAVDTTYELIEAKKLLRENRLVDLNHLKPVLDMTDWVTDEIRR